MVIGLGLQVVEIETAVADGAVAHAVVFHFVVVGILNLGPCGEQFVGSGLGVLYVEGRCCQRAVATEQGVSGCILPACHVHLDGGLRNVGFGDVDLDVGRLRGHFGCGGCGGIHPFALFDEFPCCLHLLSVHPYLHLLGGLGGADAEVRALQGLEAFEGACGPVDAYGNLVALLPACDGCEGAFAFEVCLCGAVVVVLMETTLAAWPYFVTPECVVNGCGIVVG